MKRIALFLGGTALALSSTIALAGDPEDLLPPAFRDPPPQVTPTQAPAPTPTATATGGGSATPAAPSGGSAPVVQSIPSGGGGSEPSAALPVNLPTLEELEAMEADEVNDVFGLRPRFDIPAAARRAVAEVGVLSEAEGGFPAAALANQPAQLVRAALLASDGPIVSRWGHILMRRALASRLDSPSRLNPVEFAALRARSLNGMGEGAVARTLVQDVDGSNYNRALADAAFDAYLATGDLLGMCPVARLQPDLREDGEWELLQAICSAYLGDSRGAERRLSRALGTGVASEIDVRLAQRFAGAAGQGGRAVEIEWDDVEELTPWSFALARAVGEPIPDDLRSAAPRRMDYSEVLIPASPLMARIAAADNAGARGILSSAAMVDLYSQLWVSDAYSREDKSSARLLRDAYTARNVADRLAAMQQLWDNDADDYSAKILTAYAAARMPVQDDLLDSAGPLIASMLTAGLDANALRWGSLVPEGSEGWALLTLAQPQRANRVSEGAVRRFMDDDASEQQRKSAFLIAGLAGLGRISNADFSELAGILGVNYTRSSAWSEKIGRAAQVNNPALVALLAGLGMQGSSWEQMTPRHLYHIVSALNRVGLSAEARMIAAEAVARG